MLDNVGNRSVAELMRVLEPTGTCAVVGFSSMRRQIGHMFLAPRVSREGGKRFFASSSEDPTTDDLLFLKGLLETGKMKSVIDRRYSLEELPEAIGYVETGHARAKIVIVM